MNPSRTINKIHFEDLDPIRFEDLCMSLIYSKRNWFEINHFGRKGSDGGIDIQAIEELENNSKRNWYIQCKRYKSIYKSELRSIVDAVILKNKVLPDRLLLIISCDLSKENIQYFKNYAFEKGIGNAIIWTSSVLETMLFTENQNLLFAYFGISLSREKRNKISTLKRNIKLKQKMKKNFYDTKKRHGEVLIRSIDDIHYPNYELQDSLGYYAWYKVEFYDFYYNGIEVITGIKKGIFNEQGKWDIADESKPINYASKNLFEIGRISFTNIIDYDIEGDEFTGYPHIFCDFNNNGTPYEDIIYVIPKSERISYDQRLNNNDRVKLQ